MSCLITLYLFCKASPTLLVRHAVTLQPYLSSKIETPTDSLIIQYVSKILEIVVPLMDHPNPKFLADLEEDSMKLMLKQSQNVVQSCTSCLASIINNVTHNFKFIVDGFSQFYSKYFDWSILLPTLSVLIFAHIYFREAKKYILRARVLIFTDGRFK